MKLSRGERERRSSRPRRRWRRDQTRATEDAARRGCASGTLARGQTDDHLFETLWTWTQQKSEKAQPAAPALSEPTERIASDPTLFPVLDDRANDGVVNTNRQVFDTFAGLVLGDHGDVLGRYRRDDVLDGKPLDPGLLTSGASFGDNEFFSLLRVIADGIASAIR